MTGRLPVRTGVGVNRLSYPSHPPAPGDPDGGHSVFTAESIGGLPLNEPTFAEQLRPLGYVGFDRG